MVTPPELALDGRGAFMIGAGSDIGRSQLPSIDAIDRQRYSGIRGSHTGRKEEQAELRRLERSCTGAEANGMAPVAADSAWFHAHQTNASAELCRLRKS